MVAQSLGDHLLVTLMADTDDEDARNITVSGVGRSWALRWDRLSGALREFAC